MRIQVDFRNLFIFGKGPVAAVRIEHRTTQKTLTKQIAQQSVKQSQSSVKILASSGTAKRAEKKGEIDNPGMV